MTPPDKKAEKKPDKKLDERPRARLDQPLELRRNGGSATAEPGTRPIGLAARIQRWPATGG